MYTVSETTATEELKKKPITLKGNNTEILDAMCTVLLFRGFSSLAVILPDYIFFRSSNSQLHSYNKGTH